VSDERFLNSYHDASTPPGRLEGDFTEQDEANLARLHLPEYQDKVAT
jgi:hypothetical protein